MPFFKTNKILMGALLVVGVALVIFWSRMPRTEGFANESYKMVMYGVDWCPHCVKAKPDFESLGATKTIGGKVVEFAYVNPEKDEKAVEGKDIRGYPTFHLYDPQGKLVQEYEGERTAAGVEAFLKSKL
jgi:thiol-disulfide isomerase/thioredoxin